jgi:hypothetical protein
MLAPKRYVAIGLIRLNENWGIFIRAGRPQDLI